MLINEYIYAELITFVWLKFRGHLDNISNNLLIGKQLFCKQLCCKQLMNKTRCASTIHRTIHYVSNNLLIGHRSSRDCNSFVFYFSKVHVSIFYLSILSSRFYSSIFLSVQVLLTRPTERRTASPTSRLALRVRSPTLLAHTRYGL